jgi:hypothetical protein
LCHRRSPFFSIKLVVDLDKVQLEAPVTGYETNMGDQKSAEDIFNNVAKPDEVKK